VPSFGFHKIIKKNRKYYAFYFRNFDKELSNTILTLNDIVQDYTKGKNILKTKSQSIEDVRIYAKKNKEYLKKLWFSNYENFILFLSNLRTHKPELFELLGQEQEFNYLVILQNTNEKRPNGGFFWSFAFITVQGGHIKNLEIIDSYYPDFIAYKTRLQAPDRSLSFLPEKKIWFIAANKFGFTNIDGKNIKTLYEKMFNETYEMRKVEQTMTPDLYEKLLHKYIKGVIFVRSDLFEEIMPGFTEKIWERQFVNASVDLIRGEERGNKKEIYIQEIKDYFDANKFKIAKNLIDNFQDILEKNYIQIYLSNVSTDFNGFLQENHLNNTFSSNNIYARDTNTSFNKVDHFVTKNIQIRNEYKNILIDTHNDIIPIQKLEPWIYYLKIYYTLNVPSYYATFIQDLGEKYQIQIEERELGILALQPAKHLEYEKAKRRESKSTIYFPQNIKILSSGGDQLTQKNFTTPFANGLFYQIGIDTNNTTKSINIKFQIFP